MTRLDGTTVEAPAVPLVGTATHKFSSAATTGLSTSTSPRRGPRACDDFVHEHTTGKLVVIA